LRARKLVRLVNGRLETDSSELERLFGPLLTRRMRRGGRDQLYRRLEWARIGFFTPETWVLVTTLSGPLVFLVFFSIFSLAGAEPVTALILSLLAGGGGFFYPRSTMNSRLRARAKRIRRDVIPFISLYARTATVIEDTTQVFAKMLEIAERENADRSGPGAPILRRSTQRRRQNNPYQSDIWIGLAIMMRDRTAGIHRRGATAETPDPLMNFAAFVNDEDFSTFIDRIRQARDQSRYIKPEQMDTMLENLQLHRLQEIRRGFATLLAKATVVLVAFGMPLIFTAVGGPILYAILHGVATP